MPEVQANTQSLTEKLRASTDLMIKLRDADRAGGSDDHITSMTEDEFMEFMSQYIDDVSTLLMVLDVE